jgi:hypothetical protein
MSRSVSAGIIDAIEAGTSYRSFVYARLLPSRIFYESITEDFPISPGADAVGFPDTPMPQAIGTNTSAPPSPEVHTFVNDGGTLKVLTNGNASASSLGQSLDGTPGVADDTLFRISGGTIYKHTITWSGPTIGGASAIGTPSETPLHVHGVSDTRCAFLSSGSGGLRPGVIDGTTVYEHDGRFMFPSYIATSGSGRSMSNLALYSGALELNGKVFIYVTSLDGTVRGCYWDEVSLTFSDMFTAVPTQLDVSLCEFRIANAFSHGGVAYLAGQFKRTENVETDKYYNMVLKSEDGKNFSIDRFSSVSELGYRFLATVGADNYFYLTNCNRVCYSEVTYTFDGNNDNGLKIIIPQESIKRFGTSNETGNISLKSGDETLLFDEYMEEGNKLEVYLGYETTSGSDAALYGSYIVSQKSGGIKDGGRNLALQLMSEGHWKLQAHTSPFYTEFLGRSSLYDDLSKETGNVFVAPSTTLTKSLFYVDFWSSEPHTDVANGITGINVVNNGGVDCYPIQPPKTTDPPTEIGPHKLGFRTTDLKSAMSLEDYPEVTGTSVDCLIYGWSHPEGGAGSSDLGEVVFLVEHADGTDEYKYSNNDQLFKQTYPASVTGGDPIYCTVTGLVSGDKIKKIGVIMEAPNSTQFAVARVTLYSNVSIRYRYDDPNTPWEYSTSGSGFEIPGVGRPYIMFLQKPFDAFNFSVAASFEHTVNGPNSTYPTAVGLVGLAEDGNNFILGRYNRSNNKAEIVKVRDGVETTLVSVTPTSGSPGGDFVDLLFTHRDGRFALYMPDGDNEWLEEAAYEWTDTDGYMFTSATVTKRCGIYGYLAAPSFRICPLNMLTKENSTNVDGIAYLPHESNTDFPTSGEVVIDGVKYAYTAKQAGPTTYVRGPYQLRQNGSYSPPYGDGYGVEVRDFFWTNSTGLINNRLIAISNGSVFRAEPSTASLWKVFIKTLGTTYYQYQRSRHYSNNSMIATQRLSTSMKVWITGGLLNITKISGEPTMHSEGALCQLAMDGTVVCHWVYGAGGEEDYTVEDLIQKISSHAGVKTEFPGDVEIASQAVGSGYKVATVEYRDGFDLLWESATADNFTVEADVQDTRYTGDTKVKVTLTNTGGENYELIFTSEPSSTVVETFKFTEKTNGHHFRVFFHDSFITVYMDGKWIHTFGAPEFVYDISNDVYLGGNFTATNIRLKDLCDWREAVYIDLETDAMSAIGSVIQERPIETVWRSNGGTAYWYDIVRGTIVQVVLPKSHDWTETTPRDGASDAIIYGYSEVKCLQYQPYHVNYGFATKVMRFPNLKSGALRAAKEVLERAFEGRMRHTIKIRPDIRLEVGDILDVDYNASATGTAMAFDLIIESISLDLAGGQPNMTITGREDYVE